MTSTQAQEKLDSAIAHARAGRLTQAIADVEGAIELEPDWLDPRGHLAGFLTQRAYYAEALEQYDACLVRDPGNPDAAGLASDLSRSLLSHEGALDYLRRTDASRVQDPNRLDLQIKELTRQCACLRRWPRNLLIRSTLRTVAFAVRVLRRTRAALRIAELAGATQDPTPTLLHDIAQLRYEQQTFDHLRRNRNTAAMLRQAIARDPDAPRCHCLLGRVLHEMGDMDEAVSQARRAASLAPDNATAHDVLALALVRQKSFSDAVPVYEHLARLRPNDPFVCANLGAVHQALGQTDRARTRYTRARELAPGNPFAVFFLETIDNKHSPAEASPKSGPGFCLLQDTHTSYGPPLAPVSRNLSTVIRSTLKRAIRFTAGTIRQFLSRSDFKKIRCGVCGSDRHKHLCLCMGNGWRIVRCQDCGLVFTNPQPRPHFLYGIYQDDYWEGGRIHGAEAFHRDVRSPDALQELDIALFQWLHETGFKEFESDLGPGRRAIDVGCGSGIFMREMMNRGWNVAGVEIAEDVASFCGRMGLDVRQGTLEAAAYPDATFDFATLHHVVEHVVDPAAIVREVARVLRPGGRFLIRTPCCDSLPAVLAGREWFSDPDHVFFFSQTSLRQLLERNGLRVLQTMSTVGVKYETWSKAWNDAALNDLVKEKFEEYNQGDVICIMAAVEK